MCRLRLWVLWLGVVPTIASAEIRLVSRDLLVEELVPARQK